MRGEKGRFMKAEAKLEFRPFKVGDRVECLTDGSPARTGDMGTVEYSAPERISVNWDRHGHGHIFSRDGFELLKIVDDKAVNIYLRAVVHFGISAQIQQATEELAELIVALSHHRRDRVENDVVCSEIADVEIMCAQLREIFGSDNVDTAKAAKIARLAKELAK